MQEELMATRKLVQQVKEGKPRFGQMLDKVHPLLMMTLRTVDPVIPKQLQGAVGERPLTDCDSDQTTLGAQPAPTLVANRQDVLTQGTRPAPSTKRHDVVNRQSLSQPTHWASRTSLSDDNSQLDVDTDPGDSFTVEVRRGRRKRLRKSQSQQDCGNVADIGVNAQPTVWPSVRQTVDAYTTRSTLSRSNGPSNISTGRNNKLLLVGCKQSPAAGQHYPKAAKSWTNFIEKVVYCVDNVSSLTSAEDLTNFVSGLDVKVTSCFEVKNRRPAWQRRNDSECGHKTFRLCVVNSDSEKLLQPRSWPADIVISHGSEQNRRII